MKKILVMKKTLLLLWAAAMLVSCSNSENGNNAVSTPEISGYVAEVNGFGQVVPSFTPQEMMGRGFGYSDLLKAKIGDNIEIDSVPFVTSFNEVGSFEPSYVDYNAVGTSYGFGLLNADFHLFVGGKVGDKVTIALTKKGGYKEKYELLKSTYPVERRDGETDTQYANFRMVATTGMGNGVLYRSSNPLNCEKNEGRYVVADSLARQAGIKTEIDLADTKDAIDRYLADKDFASTYCPQIYKDGNTMACGLFANVFGEVFKAKMGEMVKFMIARQPPYLIHCNEGKDRCGFVAMLLEAFMGADVTELRSDYMETMINFYHIKKGDESYLLRQDFSVDRMIWVMCHEEVLDILKAVDWSKIDVTTLGREELRKAAEKYFKAGGATDEELDALRSRLSSK